MTIAREEIFWPMLSIMTYVTIDEAVEIGNDTEYGLAAYVSGSDMNDMRDVASRLRAGQIDLNGASGNMTIPFGGFKKSGNWREWGDNGFAEYLEIKAIIGCTVQEAAE
jgi:aldehyde dehydrogenase (NAD+)